MSDVDSSLHFGHVCLQLPSESPLEEPVKVSPLPLCFLPFNSTSPPALRPHSFHLMRKSSSHMRLPPSPGFSFSPLSVISPRIIIWKSTPQLSHFPGIWLRGREMLDGAGLVGPELGCIYYPLPPKCHLSCSWQSKAALAETSEGLLATKTHHHHRRGASTAVNK